MKKRIILLSVITTSLVFVSCQDSKEENTSTQDGETTAVVEDVEVESDEMVDEYADHSVEGQWKDIVFYVSEGNKNKLDLFIDFNAPTFSQEEWDYIVLDESEYAEAFSSFESFESLPEADNYKAGAKVVTVYFETEVDGMVFESATMFYLEEREGLIWIIGCELVG